MWEAYDLGNEDFLWTGIPFMGGISGQQQAPCGALSASAVCLGLRHRCSLEDKDQAKQCRSTIRRYASDLVRSFNDKFGDISCGDLLGIDFSKPGEYQRFRDSGIWKEKCEKYIQFIIEKLYEFEDDKSANKSVAAEN
jgi:C_GCAxxG_C_C family probable redox protein